MSNIRSVSGFLRSLPDWTEFNTCFDPSRIRISDIDGIVERNGYFLILDAKSHHANGVNAGQSILYKRLAAIPKFTVLVVFAEMMSDVPGEMLSSGAEALIADIRRMRVVRVTTFAANGSTETIDADNQWLWDCIRNWYVWANSQRSW